MIGKTLRNGSLLALASLIAGCGGGGEGSSGVVTINPSPTPTPTSGSQQGPATTIGTRPAAVTKDSFAEVTFNAAGAARFECLVDLGDFASCTSPVRLLDLDPGAHEVQVRAIAADGQAGPVSSVLWTVSSIFGDAADSSRHPDIVSSAVEPSPVAPNSWRGIFRINCDFSHAAYDDPIVFPGQDGAAHLHRFYGNMLADENSTTWSLASSGQSTCQGNELNRSSYWVPSLIAPSYDPSTGARLVDAAGDPAWVMVPAVVGDNEEAHEIFYYSAGIDDLDAIQPIPVGLKMIAGNHMAGPGNEQDTSVVRWHCQSWESSDATNPRWSTSIPQCAAPDRLRMDIFFPSCWNGTDLDSADHKSHLAYPVSEGSRTVCPASHPVPIIRVSFHYAFGVLPDVYDPATRSSAGWRLASDNYTVNTATPGGMSLHADWFNAWHPEALQAILDGCIRNELDCHDGNLGGGLRISGTRPGPQTEPAVVNLGKGPG